MNRNSSIGKRVDHTEPSRSRRLGQWSLRAALLLLTAPLGCAPRNKYAPPPPPTVTVAQPERREVADTLEFTGTSRAFAAVVLKARVSGYLKELKFRDGQEVTEGDPLFLIDPEPFEARLAQAKADLNRAEAAAALAQAEINRQRQLAQRNASSSQELDLKVAALKTAQAEIDAARAAIRSAQLDLDFTVVRAPISGRIGRRLVDPGNLVEAEQTELATLDRLDPIYVEFTVSERDLLDALGTIVERARSTPALDATDPTISRAKVPPGVVLEMGLGEDRTFPFKGELDYTDTGVDPGSGTVVFRGVFPNPDRQLVPGLFCRVRVTVGAARSRLVVPERALGIDPRGEYVLVVNAEDQVEIRPVRTGPVTDNGFKVIREGLEPDEWVVVNGLQRARPGAKVAVQGRDAPSTPTGGGESADNAPNPPRNATANTGEGSLELPDPAPSRTNNAATNANATRPARPEIKDVSGSTTANGA